MTNEQMIAGIIDKADVLAERARQVGQATNLLLRGIELFHEAGQHPEFEATASINLIGAADHFYAAMVRMDGFDAAELQSALKTAIREIRALAAQGKSCQEPDMAVPSIIKLLDRYNHNHKEKSNDRREDKTRK